MLHIPILPGRALGQATRLELRQHNDLVRTNLLLLSLRACATGVQLAILVLPFGRGDDETLYEIVQIVYFLAQLCTQPPRLPPDRRLVARTGTSAHGERERARAARAPTRARPAAPTRVRAACVHRPLYDAQTCRSR